MDTMTPTLYPHIPPAPAGKVRLAEYGEAETTNARAKVTLHGAGRMRVGHSARTVPCTLRHITRGYVPAGSVMRFDEARWSVTFEDYGATHGRSFSNTPQGEQDARALFAKWTSDTEENS